MQPQSMQFSIPDMRNFVPSKLRPWIVLTFGLIFQLSGGIYMAAVSEMKGSLSLMQEDVMMAGYASLVGVALTFTIMFRLKFYLPVRNSLLITSLGVALCNLITMHTDNLAILISVCFISGFFRMWGTFTCFSAIQLWITPKRDMAVWFCFIPLIVQSAIQLSGLMAIYMAWLGTWQYMHWLIITLLLCMTLTTFIIFRHYRSMPKLPLFGIDWLGMLLWATTILSLIFIFNYGEHFDWLHSVYIRMGMTTAIVSLGLNLWRASFIRHPFINLRTWTLKPVWMTFILYIILDILLSPVHSFEHIFTENIMKYDELNYISLSWWMIAGIIAGAICIYFLFAKRRWTYRNMTITGTAFIVAYLIIMYFTLDAGLPKYRLWLPIFMRGLGYTIIAGVFLTALTSSPFPFFIQSLSVQAFMSACLGGVIGDAFITRLFNITVKKNLMLASENLDNLNTVLYQLPHNMVYEQWQLHSIIISMKEIYGWLCIAGCLTLIIFLICGSSLRPNTFQPKFSTIRHAIKHQLKLDRIAGK